jgi:putative NADPH-quinone reductase
MKNIAVILGHPAGKEASFCAALAKAYEKGARQAGHAVSFIDIGGMDIPYLKNRSDYYDPGLSAEIKTIQNKLNAATHWIIIYPLWLGCMPAKLKAFLEWALSPGFAYDTAHKKNPLSQKLLRGKSAHVIVTMGMPGWFYKWFYRAHSLKAFERNMLKFCGIAPVRKTVYGFVEAVSQDVRQKWLMKIENFGKYGV